MKLTHLFAAVASLACVTVLRAQTTPAVPAPATPKPKLVSSVFALEQLPVTKTAVGLRRAVFDGPTDTVDQLHLHVTTLNPGEKSGEPRVHLQEEVIIVKEGTIEVNADGKLSTANAGDIIYFASRATTNLRNIGPTPATYYVLYYYTPLTPKK